MKKVLLVVLSFVLLLGLVACQKETEKAYKFKGKIVEMYMSNLIVEPLEGEDIRRSSDRIQVWYGQNPEFHPPIFPQGTLVEIEYDGNINESYPAQINAISLRTIDEEGNDIIPPIADNEVPTTVAYANWAENDGGLLQDSNCLDGDKFIFSDLPRLPLFKFDTKSELDSFKDKYKDTFTMDQGHDEIQSFNDVTSNYDEEFFNEHSLMLTYKSANSGSFRYGITEVKNDKGTLVLRIDQLNNPEVYTSDMAGWFLMAEVEKDFIKDCTSYDAQLWGNYSGNIATTEINRITIANGKNDYNLIKQKINGFIDNCDNNISDEIEITQYTIEGDPIITKVVRDNTQDKFGKPEIITNEYDSSYKAKLSGEVIDGGDGVLLNSYVFQLVSEQDVVDICYFSYKD